ncbi:sprouty signaling antagonist [Lycorma delicatula]|uniref:sprouty signaling antagonist n=1 Tax=Lycorma delicatula TaxID=130591 RepID=UPI003F5171B3
MERESRDRLGDVARVHLPSRPQQQHEGVVTLTQPRPDLQRATNEYVETPLRTAKTPHHPQQPAAHSFSHSHAATVPHHHRSTSTAVVVKQPHKDVRDGGGPSVSDCSIICRECGKCRCEACRQPRPVPSLWLCDNFCLCSVETCVDYGSCLCCVKAALYHCGGGNGDDDEPCPADDPCSCAPHGRTSRWACLAVATLVLPCLCCYWPLRSCAKLSESCYAACSHRGCSCHSHPNTNNQPPEKRLLRSSPEF